MGHWGVKCYENDEAADALDAGFDRVHGPLYESLMDDRNPTPFDQVQKQLADARTLAAAVEALRASAGRPFEEFDEVERLAFAGIVLRHAEFGVPIPDDWRRQALDWLEHEAIDWQAATVRRLRRAREIALLRSIADTTPDPPPAPA
jgi:hypothetical protein